MIAETTVHTSGINWASVLTLVSSIVVLISIIVGTFVRYLTRSITSAVNNLSVVLEAKLETKEKVAQIDRRLTIVENAKRLWYN